MDGDQRRGPLQELQQVAQGVRRQQILCQVQVRQPRVAAHGVQQRRGAAGGARELVAAEGEVEEVAVQEHTLSQHAEALVRQTAPVQTQRLQRRAVQRKGQGVDAGHRERHHREVEPPKRTTWPGELGEQRQRHATDEVLGLMQRRRVGVLVHLLPNRLPPRVQVHTAGLVEANSACRQQVQIFLDVGAQPTSGELQVLERGTLRPEGGVHGGAGPEVQATVGDVQLLQPAAGGSLHDALAAHVREQSVRQLDLPRCAGAYALREGVGLLRTLDGLVAHNQALRGEAGEDLQEVNAELQAGLPVCHQRLGGGQPIGSDPALPRRRVRHPRRGPAAHGAAAARPRVVSRGGPPGARGDVGALGGGGRRAGRQSVLEATQGAPNRWQGLEDAPGPRRCGWWLQMRRRLVVLLEPLEARPGAAPALLGAAAEGAAADDWLIRCHHAAHAAPPALPPRLRSLGGQARGRGGSAQHIELLRQAQDVNKIHRGAAGTKACGVILGEWVPDIQGIHSQGLVLPAQLQRILKRRFQRRHLLAPGAPAAAPEACGGLHAAAAAAERSR
mmetsp:Transcript_88862/g.287394  ORF Transcript_88862/g.287394 Transcript_88862/m.287394 type:complete len:559 (+) Transcript_88862:825-2501(+)